MIAIDEFVNCLAQFGLSFFCGVPDSLLKNFCAYVTDHCGANHVIAANEGGAVGLAAGHYLATGKPALVYMQNSGQGNAVNPLCSLADPDVYSIPMVLLVGWRGEPGVKDEPQHVKQGKVTITLFETLGIPTWVLPDERDVEPCRGGENVDGRAASMRPPSWQEVVSFACERAIRESRPVALIVRKGLFRDYKLQNKRPDIATLKREDAIEAVLECLGDEAVVVSTTGMISREVYELREKVGQESRSTKDGALSHAKDFLTVGSMGHALMIALGLARDCTAKNPNRYVVCLDGDGAAIMQMGNMAIAGAAHQPNLIHIVLNNAAHDSVGGQPTVGGEIDFEKLAETMGYDVLQSPESQYGTANLTGEQVGEALRFDFSTLALCKEEEAKDPRPKFIQIKVAKGARADLGRPKEPPQVNKALFMETLGVRA